MQDRTIFSPEFQDAFDALCDALGIKAATAAALESEKDEYVDTWQEHNCQLNTENDYI